MNGHDNELLIKFTANLDGQRHTQPSLPLRLSEAVTRVKLRLFVTTMPLLNGKKGFVYVHTTL